MNKSPKGIIRFFIEWGASPAYLWAGNEQTLQKYGVGPIQDQILSSKTLKDRGAKLSEWFQTSLNWESPSDPSPWRQEECDRFNNAVRDFFRDLQKELGDDFELIYKQAEPKEDPDLDIYLSDPKNFHRKTTS